MPVEQPEMDKAQKEIEKEVDIIRIARHLHAARVIETYVCKREFAIIMMPAAEKNLYEYLCELDISKDGDEVETLRRRIAPWFGCLASAIAYLHAQGIRHRDIKPPNILVQKENVLLADFGIAAAYSEETISTTNLGAPRSRTRMYCSPDVDKGHTRLRSDDIFSLGAMFLEMIASHSGRGQLSRFKDFRTSNDNSSYANNIDKVFEWLNTLDDMSANAVWYPTLLYLCRNMLHGDRDQRPTADVLKSCWSYQPFSAVPQACCECNVLPHDSDGEIGEALRKASKNGHKLIACLLIERGAAIDDSGALSTASENGQTDIVEFLFQRGANANTKDEDGLTALWWAAMSGHETIMQLLIEQKADIDAKNNNGLTVPQWASRKWTREDSTTPIATWSLRQHQR